MVNKRTQFTANNDTFIDSFLNIELYRNSCFIILLLAASFAQFPDDYCMELHIGANLVSFYRLPEDTSLDYVFSQSGHLITNIIGEGVAATYLPEAGWVGSLDYINAEDGYWVEMLYPLNLCIPNAESTGSGLRYSLHEGNNLISYPNRVSLTIEEALPIGIEFYISGIIGEGIAAQYIENIGWMGSLSHFEVSKGYWIQTIHPLTFSFNSN